MTHPWEQRKLGTVAKFRQGIQVDLDNQYKENADGRERFIRIVDYTQELESKDIDIIMRSLSNLNS